MELQKEKILEVLSRIKHPGTREHIVAMGMVNEVEVTPVGMGIHGDVAVVHYYFTYAYESPDGKRGSDRGRWTDVLVKQGDKWVLFADHGGSSEDDD